MKNYKNIRKEPYLYGFTVKAFFVFVFGIVFGLFSFISGFTIAKFIGFIIYGFGLYAICKYILSNTSLLARYFDNNLPKSYSDYE